MPAERFDFPNAEGQKLAALLDRPPGEPRAYALFAHCFTCGKDVHAAKRIAEGLTALNIAVLRFDFTGLGSSEGEFANTTFSSNIADLVAAANELRRVARAPTILIGHSLGGTAVLAAASEVPEARAVVTIAAPSDPTHVTGLFKDHLGEIAARGEIEVSLAGRPFRISRTFVEDLAEQRMLERIAHLHKALLLFHSPTDAIVGIENAGRIFVAAKHPKSFISLAGADHFLSQRSDAGYVASVIRAWAERYLDVPEVAPRFAGGFQGRRRARNAPRPVSAGDHGRATPFPGRRAGRRRRPRQRSGSLRSFARWPRSLHGDDVAALRRAQGAAARAGDGRAQPRPNSRRRLRKLRDQGRDDRPHRTSHHVTRRARRHAAPALAEIADKCPVHRTLTSEVDIRTVERRDADDAKPAG